MNQNLSPASPQVFYSVLPPGNTFNQPSLPTNQVAGCLRFMSQEIAALRVDLTTLKQQQDGNARLYSGEAAKVVEASNQGFRRIQQSITETKTMHKSIEQAMTTQSNHQYHETARKLDRLSEAFEQYSQSIYRIEGNLQTLDGSVSNLSNQFIQQESAQVQAQDISSSSQAVMLAELKSYIEERLGTMEELVKANQSRQEMVPPSNTTHARGCDTSGQCKTAELCLCRDRTRKIAANRRKLTGWETDKRHLRNTRSRSAALVRAI